MPLITETYYLSLTQDNRGILRLRCSQDDTLRTVNLKLYNNGSIFAIPSGVSASISGVKQNGVVFSKPCTISQDRESIVLQLSSDITNTDGIIVAEIVLNDGEGGRLGTSNFIIQVEKNPIRAGVVQDTETPIEYINDFIDKIQTLTARLNNLITPSGDASLAEVVDARIGVLDSTTYQTLGARLNAEFQRLSNALNGVTILESTGDTTDRTNEILSKLNVYGACKLGKGDFYVNGLVMPEDSTLVGSGNSTRIVLLGSETNTYIVKPRSNCIVENISFYGGFTGTYSELIANSDARRHCIILDKFNDVNSENVILSNIFINNFVGSAIVQRATNGCHCKDVVINMCYAGIDISNASYDGQCANTYISNTKFGIIQNGSNFVFSSCISKDSVQHIMSDQQNTECTFSSCTFFDSSLETTAKLASLSNTRNGFVFDNCMFDSSLSMLLNACDGIVIKGTNFVGSDTFAITVSNGRNTLLLITDCIADVEPVVTNAGTAARITSCYLKDGTAWAISEADITVDDELDSESENPVQNKVINRAIGELKADLGALTKPQRLADGTDLDTVLTPGVYMLYANNSYLHKPTADSEHGILEVLHEDFGDNTGRTFQRLTYTYKAGRTNIEIWVRTYSVLTSTWSVWISATEDLSRKLMLLSESLQSQTGVISKVNGSYISLITDPVSLTPVVDASWSYSIVSCTEDDKFIINAEGGQRPRAWGFLDSGNHVLSMADASTVVEDLELTAPANAVKLVINDKSGAVSYIPSAFLLTKIAESAQGKVDIQQSPGDYGKALVINRDGQVRPSVVSGGSGLTDSVKVALLACFRHVLWDDEHSVDYYNALEAALYAAESRLTAVIDYGNATVFTDDPLAKIKWMMKVYYDGVEIHPRDYTLTGSMIVGDNVLTVTYNDESTTIMVYAEESLPRRISLTAGNLLKYDGLGLSTSGGIHKIPYLVAETNHRVYYTAKGHAPYFDENNGIVEGMYPIPIPAWATHVRASVAPHSYEISLNCWRYNNSSFDYSIISGTASGFHAQNSEADVPQFESNARAVNVIIQKPSGSDAFDPSTEATEIVVVFS